MNKAKVVHLDLTCSGIDYKKLDGITSKDITAEELDKFLDSERYCGCDMCCPIK